MASWCYYFQAHIISQYLAHATQIAMQLSEVVQYDDTLPITQWMEWCGLIISPYSLDVRVDYSRYKLAGEQSVIHE